MSTESKSPAGPSWRDPHSISGELDEPTLHAIVARLESRGRDPIFQSLFDTYFSRVLDGQFASVLEIGAGTGVICRALASRGFTGRIFGIDQSSVFVDAAIRLAAEEGLDSDRIAFCVGNARTLREDASGLLGGGEASADGQFDCLIMHTLISHVDDPLNVLRTARSVARLGAMLVIVDGDYTGLSYHSSTKTALSQKVSKALVTATFAQPGIVRELPSLLAEAGWELEHTTGRCVCEIGGEFSYWKTFAEAYMPRVIGSGLVPQSDVEEWWADQLRRLELKQIFASCTYYTMLARAV